MRLSKALLIVLAVLFTAGSLFAFGNLTFNDVVLVEGKSATLVKIHQENPAYPLGTTEALNPAAQRWVIQLYHAGTNNAIDPLNEDGTPGGDDIQVSIAPHVNATQGLTFSTTGRWQPSGIRVYTAGESAGSDVIQVYQGDKVFIRIFNNTSIATSTKYMQFLVPWTIQMNWNAVPVIANGLGWSDWISFGAPATHTISGTITSANHAAQIANVTFTVDPDEDTEVDYVGATGVFTVTVPDGWTGTITPVLAGYEFTPAVGVTGSYTNVVENIEDQDYALKGNVNPNAPTTAGPANGHIFKIKRGTTRTVQLSWNAPAGGHTPEGYEVQVNGGDWIDNALLTTYTTAALGGGNHTWKVRAYVNTPKGKVSTPVRASATARSASVAAPKGNSDEANGNFTIEEFDVVPTVPTVVPTVTPGVNITIEVVGGETNFVEEFVPTPVPNPTFVPVFQNAFVLFGNPVQWDFSFETTSLWGTWRLLPGGAWNLVPNVGGFITFSVPAAKDGEPEIEYKEGDENPLDEPILPVTLSSFTAQLTAQSFVKLTWVTETETNMLGYRIYRGESNVQADAVLVTPIMIEATNTSQTHTYTIEDREVQIGRSYWYWLESVDYINSNFYTPQNVVVTGESTPVLPQVTALKNAYPNPFKANSNTTIEVAVKEGEAGSVTIYNVLGQAVKTFSVKEGLNPLKWNGRDSKGNICGSGIYFYKLSTPSTNQTKKMVIVK